MTPLAATITGALMTLTGVSGMSASGHAIGCVTLTHALAVGSRGEEVRQIQAILNVPQTGYFGEITKADLIVWQIQHKVIDSALAPGAGQVGPKTRAAISCANEHSALPLGLTIYAATTTPATTTPAIAPVANMSIVPSGGGSAPQCPALPRKPSDASCDTGPWQVYPDEAGCDVWACTTTDDRG